MSILDVVTGPLAPIIGIIDKIIPDIQANAEAKNKLLAAYQAGELQQLLGQISINLADAKSEDAYQRRWRPTLGWACALGFGFLFVIRPLVFDVANLFDHFTNGVPIAPTTFDTASLMSMTFGVLGLAVTRAVEKSPGPVATVISAITGKGKPQ